MSRDWRFFDPSRARRAMRWLLRWRAWVVAAAVVASALTLVAASRLTIDTNLIALLPPNAPSVRALRKVLDKTGGTGELMVMVESARPEAALAYAGALVPLVRTLPWVADARHGPDPRFLDRNRLLYLDLADLRTVDDRVRAYLDREISSKNPLYVDLDEEPNRLDLEDIEARYRTRGEARRHYQSPDGRLVLVVVLPRGSAGDVAHARRIDAELAAAVAVTPPPPGVAVSLGGTVRSRLAELDAINRDVNSGAWVVAISIGLLLSIYFRHPFAVIPLFIPVAMSLAWTFGFTYFAIGSLNLVTAFLFAVLTGLGVEIGIHILVRFQAERRRGGSIEDILTESMLHAGRPALMAAISSALSFAALLLVEFRGFSDFGLIAAVGLLCASAAYAVVFPALLSWVHQWGWMRPRAAREERPGRPLPRPGAIVAAAAVAGAIALAFAPRAGFEHDLRNIRSRLPEVRAFNAKVREVFPRARDPAAIVVEDPAAVPAVVAAVQARRQAGGEASAIAEVRSIADLLPRDLDAKLAIAAGLRARVERVRGRVSAEEARRIDEVVPFLDPQPIRSPADLPASVRRPFEGAGGGPGQLVLVYQKGSLLDLREAVAFSRALADLTVDGRSYQAASEPLVYADLYAVLARDAPRAVALTLVSLLLILALDFRSARDTALAFLPLALGTIWTVGAMGAFDLQLNLLNAPVVAVAFGLGIDAGVHVIHHVRELGVGRMTEVMRETGLAVGVCTGVNLLGFAGMLVTDHPGLRSIGYLAIVALVATYIAGAGFFPAFIAWRRDISRVKTDN